MPLFQAAHGAETPAGSHLESPPTGLPVIAAGGGKRTILGSGAVVERSTATGTPPFRLLVAAGASLTLENMTLQGGLVREPWFAAKGGAIHTRIRPRATRAKGSAAASSSIRLPWSAWLLSR